MWTVFEQNRGILRLVVIAGYLIVSTIAFNELFMTQDNLMHWMMKTVQSGDIKWNELVPKAHLFALIPGVFFVDKVRKMVF